MTLNQAEQHLPIGHTLKIARAELGLTQKQMAAGVISTSYYSKVENGQHEIDAESLFKILHAHDFSISRFNYLLFSSGEFKNDSLKDFFNKLIVAQNTGNKSALDELFAAVKAKKYSNLDEITMYDIFVTVAYSWMYGSSKDVPDVIKKAARSEILKKDWTINSIWRFSDYMLLFDIDECYILVNSILNSKKLNTHVSMTKMTIDLMLVNYCDYCQLKNVDKKYVEEAIKFLKSSRELYDPLLIGYSILGVYYEALFDHDVKKARMIRDVLVESGVDWSIRRSIKKLEEE